MAGKPERAVDVYRELTNIDLPEDAFHVQAHLVLSDGDDLRGMLELLAPELSDEECSTVLEGAVRVAIADGDLAASERPAVSELAETLRMQPADVRAIVAKLSPGSARRVG